MTNIDPPMSSDTIDELLSAELDDDLEAAADALGLTPDEARAALATTPGADARRRALAAARDVLATPPTLDAATLDRLVSRASRRTTGDELAARRRDRRRRAVVSTASVAAAIVVVTLGVALMHSSTGSESKRTSVAAPARPAPGAKEGTARRVPTTPTAGIHFGDVSQHEALRSRVLDRLRTPGAAFLAAPQTTESGKASGRAETATTRFRTSTDQKDATAAAPPDLAVSCPTAARSRLDLPANPVLSGTGKSGGRRVDVLVFASGKQYVVYVLSSTNCSLVTKLTLP